jgi:hypothetical protein
MRCPHERAVDATPLKSLKSYVAYLFYIGDSIYCKRPKIINKWREAGETGINIINSS